MEKMHDKDAGFSRWDVECRECLHHWTATTPLAASRDTIACPRCGEKRPRDYVLRNNTAREHAIFAMQQVAMVYANLPKDHPGEHRLAGALCHLRGVLGREVAGPFGDYVPDGHLGNQL